MKSSILILFLIFFLALKVNAETKINEIMYDPEGSDNNLEFIEIFSDEITSLENYTIEDLSGSSDELTLLKQIDSNYFLIVEEDFNYENINTTIYTSGATIGNGLNNDGDIIILRDDEGKIVDLVHYYSDWGASNNDKSLERINFNDFSSDPRNWVESNIDEGTPGKQNSIPILDYSKLKINELLADPIGDDNALMPNGEFIEILNEDNKEIDLNGFYLEDDFGHRITIDNTHAYTTLIPANGYLVVYTNGFSGLLNNDEDKINLFYNSILLDKVEYSLPQEGFSWAKVDNAWVLRNPTPNEENNFGLIINQSSVKILEYDKNADFGDLLEIKLAVYKADTIKNAINLILENDKNDISDELNFNIYGKYVNYTLNVPLKIYDNCDSKYGDGEYTLKVSGLDSNDEKTIDVNGINEDLCNIENISENNEDISIELLDVPKEITNNNEVITKVKLTNNQEKVQNLEVWSYIYSGLNSISGDFQDNLKNIKLNPNQELTIDLSNKIEENAEPGEYKLKVRIKKESKKTTTDFVSDISLVDSSYINDKLNSNVIYESSDIKTKNLASFIFIFVLVLMILVLVLRKGL